MEASPSHASAQSSLPNPTPWRWTWPTHSSSSSSRRRTSSSYSNSNSNRNRDAVTGGGGSWETLHQVATPHPCSIHDGDGPTPPSIATVWEVWIGNDNNENSSSSTSSSNRTAASSSNRRMRIAVYSGPDEGGSDYDAKNLHSAPRTLHASFELPADAQALIETATTTTAATATAGLSSPRQQHQQLPQEQSIPQQSQQSNRMCWTSFPNRDNTKNKSTAPTDHPMLCVLLHPTAIAFWDVYPSNSDSASSLEQSAQAGTMIPPEGWTITLPFDCHSIFAANPFGLLLQRIQDVEDYDYFQYHQHIIQQQQDQQKAATTTAGPSSSSSSTSSSVAGTGMDGFFLKSPTTTTGMPRSTFTPPLPLPEGATSDAHMFMSPPPMPVNSLFSLPHPFEDIVPVLFQPIRNSDEATNADAPDPATEQSWFEPMTDAFESLLWVGTIDDHSNYENHDRPEPSTWALTYHWHWHRHALWHVQAAPSPPPPLPLHQWTRQQYRISSSLSASDHLNLQHVMPDVDLLGLRGKAATQSAKNTTTMAADRDWLERVDILDPRNPFMTTAAGGTPTAAMMVQGRSPTAAAVIASSSAQLPSNQAMSQPSAALQTARTQLRQDALADALGVRRTPRASLNNAVNNINNHFAVPLDGPTVTSRSRQHRNSIHGNNLHAAGGSVDGPPSFFSPANRSALSHAGAVAGTGPHFAAAAHGAVVFDTTSGGITPSVQAATFMMEGMDPAHAAAMAMMLASSSTTSWLHAKVAMTCVYQEPAYSTFAQNPCAEQAFWVSPATTHGTSGILCLLQTAANPSRKASTNAFSFLPPPKSSAKKLKMFPRSSNNAAGTGDVVRTAPLEPKQVQLWALKPPPPSTKAGLSLPQRMISRSDGSLKVPPALQLPIITSATTWRVDPVITIPCMAAQPVQLVPRVGVGVGRRGCATSNSIPSKCFATELLLMRSNPLSISMVASFQPPPPCNNQLQIYRANVPIADLVVQLDNENDDDEKDSNGVRLLDMTHAVFDRVSLQLIGVSRGKTTMESSWWARVRLNWAFSSSTVEGLLAAMDASLIAIRGKQNESDSLRPIMGIIALLLRADCHRLIQSLQTLPEPPEHIEIVALEVVLKAIARWELQQIAFTARDMEDNPDEILKAITMPDDDDRDDDWDALLKSEYHASYMTANEDFLFLGSKSISSGNNPAINLLHKFQYETAECILASIQSLTVNYLSQSCVLRGTSRDEIFAHLFDSVHRYYENAKLDTVRGLGESYQVARILVRLCAWIQTVDPSNQKIIDFLDYYSIDIRELATLLLNDDTGKSHALSCASSSIASDDDDAVWKWTCMERPLCFFSWIEALLKGEDFVQASNHHFGPIGWDGINISCTRLRSVYRIFQALALTDDGTAVANRCRDRDIKVIQVLTAEGFNDLVSIRDGLPPGVAVPILEVLQRCRVDPKIVEWPGWTSDSFTLIDRQDLAKNLLLEDSIGQSLLDDHDDSAEQDEDKDGLVPLEYSSSMLFPSDNRIHEAARLLRSSRPIFLRVHRAVEDSDHDYERLKQKRLLLLCRRALALPIGRGMLTFGRMKPVPAEALPVPELCLKGRVPPTHSTLALDVSESPTDLRVWPEFHNGVAAGLRLPKALNQGNSKERFSISRTWIVYNRPSPSLGTNSETEGDGDALSALRKSHAHGGLLLALGLRGHLTALDMSDIYEYLTQGTVTTTVGVLLGMAVSKRGSCDMAISKMLCLHIPSLIPHHFSAIDVASTVQTAAVMGAGFLFQQSSHRMMTEFLLNEIGKRPDSDASAFDREAYTLSCGLALGMVNLCVGFKSEGIDRAAGIADLRMEERLHRYIVGGTDKDEHRRIRESNDRFSLPSQPNGADNEKCCTIYEGESHINTDVTAPGAVLALGLMYMKTGNHSIAAILALPDTHFLLDFVRPDFLTLRVMSRALILWDHVDPTREWIEQQVPEVVRHAYQQMQTAARLSSQGVSKIRMNMDFDRRSVRQMHVHIVAGACFAIGLRYAGTGDGRAKTTLMERILELNKLREGTDPVSLASRPEQPILETCVGTAAIGLAMVVAGTGDLDVLRLFKVLRWKCDPNIKYGHHMIYGMAIGLLFLGGGTCTLGREPSDIAALVVAFFPRYPLRTADNQYHLQALRHMYALAIRRRDIYAIDVDTREPVFVPIQLRMGNDIRSTAATTGTLQLTTPCLLRNSDQQYRELVVVSRYYYPLKLNLVDRFRGGGGDVDVDHDQGFVFYVKRRNSTTQHNRLGGGVRGDWEKDISSRWQLMIDECDDHDDVTSHVVHDLTENSFFLSTMKRYLCEQHDHTNGRNVLSPQELAESLFVRRVWEECVVRDTQHALPIYLSLYSMTKRNKAILYWNLRLLRTYYRNRTQLLFQNPGTEPEDETVLLMNTRLMLPYLHEMTEQHIATILSEDDAVNAARIFYSD